MEFIMGFKDAIILTLINVAQTKVLKFSSNRQISKPGMYGSTYLRSMIFGGSYP
jgi:hypothetical protein